MTGRRLVGAMPRPIHYLDHAATTPMVPAAYDVMAAHRVLKAGFLTDVSPILAEARMRQGGACDPITVYRASGYRDSVAVKRPPKAGASGSGIV